MVGGNRAHGAACSRPLIGHALHQVVDLVVEALHLRFYSEEMRRNGIAIIAQHVEDHVARKEHVGEFIDHLGLQRRLRFLEDRLFEERNISDDLREFVREFSFFVSHLL